MKEFLFQEENFVPQQSVYLVTIKYCQQAPNANRKFQPDHFDHSVLAT